MSNYRRRLLLANQTEENLYLYGNSVQEGTPTPEAPIEIMSVENPTIKVRSNNLFKTTNYTKGTLDSATGNITSATAVRTYCLTTDYIYLKSGVYVVSNIAGANLRYICFYGSNKEFKTATWTYRVKSYKFTITEDCYVRIDVERDENVAIDNFDTFCDEYRFMLQKISTGDNIIPLPYEPYYEENITMDEIHIPFGNNLFNFNIDLIKKGYPDFGEATLVEKTENGVIVQGNVATTGAPGMSSWYNGWFQPHITKTTNGAYIKNGDTVTISADYTWLDITNYDKTSSFAIHLCTQNNTGNNINKAISKIPTEEDIGKTYRVSVTHTNTKKDGYYIPIFCLNSCKIKIENIQIAYNKNTVYEPYTPPTFRGIGDYKDKIYTKDGKVWFEQRSGLYEVTADDIITVGASTWNAVDNEDVNMRPISLTNHREQENPGLCSHYIYSEESYRGAKKGTAVVTQYGQTNRRLWVFPEINFTTTKEAQEWISNNTITTVYPLVTPIITEITGSLAEKILAIDKTKNIYFISENGIYGETEVIEE